MQYTVNDNKQNVAHEFYKQNMFISTEFLICSDYAKSYFFNYNLMDDAVCVKWNLAIKNIEKYFIEKGRGLYPINELHIGRALYVANIYKDFNFIKSVTEALDFLRGSFKYIDINGNDIKEKTNVFLSDKYNKYLKVWNRLFLYVNKSTDNAKYVSEIIEEIKIMNGIVTSITDPVKKETAELEKVESNEDNTELKHVDPVEMKEIVVECGSFEYAIRKAYEDLVSTINNFLNNEDNSSTFTYRNKDDVFIVDRLNNGIVGNYFIVRQMHVHEFNEGEKDVRQMASKIFPEENKEGLVTYLSEMIIGRTNVSFVSNMPKYSMFTQ